MRGGGVNVVLTSKFWTFSLLKNALIVDDLTIVKVSVKKVNKKNKKYKIVLEKLIIAIQLFCDYKKILL